MNKILTRASLVAASALSFALVGMSGAASANPMVSVSTMGPGSGVNISIGGGCNGGCGGGSWNTGNDWGNGCNNSCGNTWNNGGNNEWGNSCNNSCGNTWHQDNSNMSKCQKHEDGWKMNKHNKCCKKVSWVSSCWTRVCGGWNWCRRISW